MEVQKFFPQESTNFSHKIEPYEFLPFYIPAALIFTGSIDQARFTKALEKTLRSFNFLFSRFKTRDNGLYAEYASDNENYYVSLEIDKSQESITDTFQSNLNLFPSLIDKRVNGVSYQVDDLPMIYFKLTYLQDGISLAYIFNHTFLDQSSLVFFLKTLSQNYNNSKLKLPPPKLIDHKQILPHKRIYHDLDEFRKIGKKHHRIYQPDLTKIKLTKEYYPDLILCMLHFPTEKLNKLKTSIAEYVSANDIINAIVMKIYASNTSQKEDNTVNLEITANMRKNLGLNESDIGNALCSTMLSDVPISEIRQASIKDMAVRLRNVVKGINKDIYLERLNWSMNFLENNESYNNYLLRLFIDPTVITTTNWANFLYQEITFGDKTQPVTIEEPLSAPMLPYLTRVLFNKHLADELILSLVLPIDAIPYARQLGQETGLFLLKEIKTNLK